MLYLPVKKNIKIARINKASVARISDKIDFTFKDISMISFYVDKNPYWHARKFTYTLHTNLPISVFVNLKIHYFVVVIILYANGSRG